jgi:hypothetical protein
MFFANDDLSQWFQPLLRPEVLPFVIAGIAVFGGVVIAIAKVIMHHRERMAKIEHGIDPDAKEALPNPQSGEHANV